MKTRKSQSVSMFNISQSTRQKLFPIIPITLSCFMVTAISLAQSVTHSLQTELTDEDRSTVIVHDMNDHAMAVRIDGDQYHTNNTDNETYWWNNSVFYEIFVRSFYDSDGDGIGDFQGIIQKLDYLNDGDSMTHTDLGITGIWLMPMMESPSYHGYDVTNYYATQPDYGTMEDFEQLLDAAHDRGIRVIIDFVINHCSDRNPWFTQSAKDQNGYRDWFRWTDTKPDYLGPWGQQVWHNKREEYYYGVFSPRMPDLNYDNPAVRQEMYQVAKFWLDIGVDGFRMDAIKHLVEDGAVLENTPRTLEELHELNTIYKSHNPEILVVGEVWSETEEVVPYVQNDRLDLCFEFYLAYAIINGINENNPDWLISQIQTVQSEYPHLQYATFLTNHDMSRVFSTFDSNIGKMKQAAALYLTLPGIPFMYYGEEIGMMGTEEKHENLRSPMQWTGDKRTGFSTHSPWYPVGSNYSSNNVYDMQGDSNSILEYYKTLIHLRNKLVPLRLGQLFFLENSNDGLLSYARIFEDEVVIVLSNFSDQPLAPSISTAINTKPLSSLSSVKYIVTDELSNKKLGSMTLNSDSGFTNWKPKNRKLNPGETWIFLLTPE